MKSLLYLILAVCATHSQEQITLEVRSLHDATGFTSKLFSRCGRNASFSSIVSDSLGNRKIAIIHDRESWQFESKTKTGGYFEDIGKSFDIYLPIFADSQVMKKNEIVEWGREMEWLAKGRETVTQTFLRGGITYSFLRDSVPRQLIVTRNSDTLGAYLYTSYKIDPGCDEALFSQPNGVDFSKSAAEDLKWIFLDWTKPMEKQRMKLYSTLGILKRLSLMGPLLSENKQLPMIGFLAGMNEKLAAKKKLELISYTIQHPKEMGTLLFKKSLRFNVDSLRGLKIQSPGQFDFFWGHYYATRNVKDLQFIVSAFSTKDTSFAKTATAEFINASKKAATWSVKSHLSTLDFFKSDLNKSAAEVDDPSTLEFLRWALTQ